jgi:hypothetical protein
MMLQLIRLLLSHSCTPAPALLLVLCLPVLLLHQVFCHWLHMMVLISSRSNPGGPWTLLVRLQLANKGYVTAASVDHQIDCAVVKQAALLYRPSPSRLFWQLATRKRQSAGL